MPFTTLYLFVKLDTEYSYLESETIEYIYKTFHSISKDNIHIKFDRYTRQEQWTSLITHLYKTDPTQLVFLCNNDDHIFIDVNMDLIHEGIELLKKEENKLSSIYFSHFPEIIKHSLLFEPERIGNYVKFKCSIFDSIQIMNMELIYFIFVKHKWNGEHIRIDTIIFEVSSKPAMSNEVNQVMYIPLRELCRKFNGYGHVNMDETIFPVLHLPQNTFYYSEQDIEKRMTAPHTGWSVMFNNKNKIPREWITTAIRLYKGFTSHTVSLPEHYSDINETNNSPYLSLSHLFSFY